MPRLVVLALCLLVARSVVADDSEPRGLVFRLELASSVADLRFSPDGTRLAVGTFDKLVEIFDVETGKLVAACEGHGGRVTAVAWSPDQKTLATGCDDGSIRFWEAATGKHTGTIEDAHSQGRHGHGVTTLGYFPDGASFYSTGYDPRIRIWNAVTHKEIRCLAGHRDCAVACLTPDGKHLVSTSQDGTARVWDPATGATLVPLAFELDRAMSPHLGFPCVSPDGRWVYAGAGDGQMRSWAIPSGRPGPAWHAHGGFVGGIDVSPVGGLLVTGGQHPNGALGIPDDSWDNKVRLWDARTGERLLELGGHTMTVCRCRFSAGGARLATASWDRTVVVWDLAALELSPEAVALEGDESLWARLGESKGPRSWTAARALSSRPARAVLVCDTRLRPVAPDPELPRTLERLIRELDDGAWAVRERAHVELVRLGIRAHAALRAALAAAPSAEVRTRATRILETRVDWAPASEDERRWVRAVALLAEVGTPDAVRLLERLAGGDPSSALTERARAALEATSRR